MGLPNNVKYRITMSLGVAARKPVDCPSGWHFTEAGDCVAVMDEPKTYLDAYLTCVANGADLFWVNASDVKMDVNLRNL